MGALLFFHIRVTNIKLIHEKKSMSGVAQADSKVVVAWMWSLTDGNLSYLCLGTTFLLVAETFKIKNFET